MNRDQREALELVLAGIRQVDGVFRRLARDVCALFVGMRAIDRRVLRGQLDRILDRVFGLTQKAAVVSELFTTIIRATGPAADQPFLRLLERVTRAVYPRNPELWQRAFPRLVERVFPLPGVWTLPPIDPTDPDNWQMLVNELRRRSAGERLARARILDPQRRWVAPNGYRLSDRIWREGQDVRRAIDRRIGLAIQRGEDPISVAVDLEKYLDPAYQPLRTVNGSIIVDQRKGVYSLRPRGGHGSNASRRLVRTEMMRVHGQATIRSAATVPGVVGVRWNLSGSHPQPDPCDDKADGSSRGLPRGVYAPDEVPAYPTHPNEMCYLTHEMMSRGEVIDLIARRYGA